MKNNINKKIGATLLTAAVMTGTFITPTVKADTEVKTPSISYQAHVQNIGWMDFVTEGVAGVTGNALRMEALRMHIENCENVTLSFDVHVQDIGWIRNLTENDIIGTEGQSRRLEAIVIRSNGLREQGYKLQYKVHIENFGWDGWYEEGQMAGTEGQSRRLEGIEIRLVKIEDDLSEARKEAIAKISEVLDNLDKYSAENQKAILAIVEEAKNAINNATSKEAIETVVSTIENRIADVKTLEQEELEKVKEQVGTLENYKAVFEAEIERLEAIVAPTPAQEKQKENYKEIVERIEKSIETINKAETLEEAKKAYDEEVSNIKGIQPNIDTLSEENIAKTKEAQEKASAKIDIYKEVLPDIENLTENDKEIINTILSNATADINNANTPGKAEKAISRLEGIMATSSLGIKKYNDVALAVARKEASNILNAYAENATQGVKTLVEKNVEDINETTTIKGIEGILEIAEDEIEELIETQDEQLSRLNAYENAVNASDLSRADKAVVKNEIDKVRAQIENATNAEDIISADEDIDTIISTFNEYMNGRYDEVVEKAQEELLEIAKNKATEKLSKYSEYEELKEDTTKAINDIKENAKTEQEVAEKLKEAIEVGYTTEEGVVVKGLEARAQEIEDAKQLQKDLYASAYKTAIEELNACEEIMKELELTDAQRKDIESVIENTKTNITKVTTANDVTKAMSVFEDYMSTYYKEVSEDIETYKLEQTRNNAIETLKAYENSKINGVSKIAKDAISAIEKVKVTQKVTTEQAIDLIINKLDEAQREINTLRLEAVKKEAYTKFDSYVDYTMTDNADTEIDESVIATDIQKVANKAVTEIMNVILSDNIEKDIEKINDIVENGIDEIEEKLDLIGKNNQEAIEEAREEALEKVNKYMDMAKELKLTEAQNEINLYIDAINDINDAKKFDAKVREFNEYIKEHQESLYNKVKAVEDIQKVLENSSNKENKEIISAVEKAIADVKAAKDVTDASGKTTPEAQVIQDIITAVTEEVNVTIPNKYKELIDEQKRVKELISKLNKDYDEYVKNLISEAIAEIDSITLDEFEKDAEEKEPTDPTCVEKIYNDVVSKINAHVAYVEGEALTSVIASAKVELTEYAGDYSTYSKANKDIIDNAIASMGALTDIDNIDSIIATAKTHIDAAKLAEAKEVAKKEIDKYKNDKTIDSTKVSAIEEAITKAKSDIDNASTQSEIDTLLQEIKEEIDNAVQV